MAFRLAFGAAAGCVTALGFLTAHAPAAMADHGLAAAAVQLFPYSAAAHRSLALQAREGSAAEATRHATGALRRAPLDQATLTTLALAATGEQRARFLNLSAALGWRDTLTQTWLALAAAQQGDYATYALRFDATARQITDITPAAPLLDAEINKPAVRAALVPRLVTRPRWRFTYLSTPNTTDVRILSARVALVHELARAGSPPSRVDVAAMLSTLGTLDPRVGRDLWRRYVARPALATSPVYDERFAMPEAGDDLTFPWEWNTPDGARGTVESVVESGERLLRAEHDGTADGPVLAQRLGLAPGAYRLRIDGSDPTAASGFVWQVRCETIGVPLADPGEPQRILVPPGCAVQLIELVAQPATGAQSASYRRVRIEPTR